MWIDEKEARRLICEYGDLLYRRGFVAANDGNISIRVSDTHIVVTPTGVSKGGMTPDMLVRMQLDGTIDPGQSRVPSSEVKMHIRVYEKNPHVGAVLHAHPPLSTAYAVARVPMDRPFMSESVLLLGSVPVAEYALPGTTDVPDSIEPFVTTHNAVLLANHGVLTWGANLSQAMHRLEAVEQYAIVMKSVRELGLKPCELNREQVSDLEAIRKRLGISTGGGY